MLFVEHDAGIPEFDLFDYDTIVRYRVCEDDGTVTVTGISDFENIDFGLYYPRCSSPFSGSTSKLSDPHRRRPIPTRSAGSRCLRGRRVLHDIRFEGLYCAEGRRRDRGKLTERLLKACKEGYCGMAADRSWPTLTNRSWRSAKPLTASTNGCVLSAYLAPLPKS